MWIALRVTHTKSQKLFYAWSAVRKYLLKCSFNCKCGKSISDIFCEHRLDNLEKQHYVNCYWNKKTFTFRLLLSKYWPIILPEWTARKSINLRKLKRSPQKCVRLQNYRDSRRDTRSSYKPYYFCQRSAFRSHFQGTYSFCNKFRSCINCKELGY